VYGALRWPTPSQIQGCARSPGHPFSGRKLGQDLVLAIQGRIIYIHIIKECSSYLSVSVRVVVADHYEPECGAHPERGGGQGFVPMQENKFALVCVQRGCPLRPCPTSQPIALSDISTQPESALESRSVVLLYMWYIKL
jgi:hypothetical protein